MSFLTKGKWNRAALKVHAALGFNPVDVVRRAVLNGTLLKPVRGRPQGPERPKVSSAAAHRSRRARYYAAGLTATGQPRKVKSHPELKRVARTEYRALWMRKRRQSTRTGPVRRYVRRAPASAGRPKPEQP